MSHNSIEKELKDDTLIEIIIALLLFIPFLVFLITAFLIKCVILVFKKAKKTLFRVF